MLVGQFFHETHGFNPQPTREGQLAIARGPAVVESARGGASSLAGIIRTLEALCCELVPSLAVFAPPSGSIQQHLYEQLRDELIARAAEGSIDAIALDMHGAMCTTALDDADGDLLSRLRAAVGPAIPIAIGLDMHAHVTAAMLEAVDICTACKQTPHIDFAESGDRLATLLHEQLLGRLRPVMAMAKAPMIHLDAGLTDAGPLAEICAIAHARTAENDTIHDISLFQVYRFADYREAKGQTALVLTDGDAATASTHAKELADWFWHHRNSFCETLLTIEEALDRVAGDPVSRPFILADTGDRTMAGGPGDSVLILEAALKHPARLSGVVPVTDAAAVAACRELGVGAELDLAIGGSITPGFAPMQVTGRVMALGDGEFETAGPAFAGRYQLGATAVLEIDGRLTVLLMSEAGQTHAPAAFTSQGIELVGQDFVVSKSGQHFRANFAGTPLVVATPGLTFPAKGFFAWRNPHFWPEEDLQDIEITAQVFHASRPAIAESAPAAPASSPRRQAATGDAPNEAGVR